MFQQVRCGDALAVHRAQAAVCPTAIDAATIAVASVSFVSERW